MAQRRACDVQGRGPADRTENRNKEAMSKPKTIKDLAIKHDYYSSDHNYYSNEARTEYSHWPAFAAEAAQSDEDLNLCFRWDVHQDDYGRYYMEVFCIRQRKGLYWPYLIRSITDEDVPSILEYLGRHWAKLQRLWCPLSIADLSQIPDPVDAKAASPNTDHP